ncbi:MAG: hypothetical protein GF331_14785 [Chitinivibrionales bacterium]|nr:hypothetical protein [Chitinivibrionales bacterium]
MPRKPLQPNTVELSARDEPVTTVIDRISEALNGRVTYSRSSLLDGDGNEPVVSSGGAKMSPEEALEAVATAVGSRVMRTETTYVVTLRGTAALPTALPAIVAGLLAAIRESAAEPGDIESF